MPDTLSLSTGVSLGLLAGIVSGVCYLFANGINKPKEQDTHTKTCVAAADKHICRRCGGDNLGGLVPCICEYHQPVKFESGAWFLRQVQRAISLMPWSFSTDKLEQIDEECEGGSESQDLHNVREFLEAISAKLAGGPLEGTRVAPLYDHPAYLPKSSATHTHSRHSIGATGAHAQLKRFVARVVEEAAALPALARYAAEPHTPTESSYEDLLATAILNKVIERYQTESGSGGRSSGIHSASASPSPSEGTPPRSLHSRSTREISPPHVEEDVSDWEEGEATDDAVELPRRVPFPEYGGDIIHETENADDFDEVSGSDIQAVDGSWEENWLFQKKKIKNIQSVPVPMLVPNSNTEYRALIGDRDADDTTDLSDNASETEEQDIEYKSDIKKVLDSKHVIGGKLKVDEALDFEPDSLMSVDGADEFEKIYNEYSKSEDTVDSVNPSAVTKNITTEEIDNNHEDSHDSILLVGVDSGPIPKTEFNLKEEIHRTVMNGHAEYDDMADSKEIMKDSLESINEKESSNMNTLSRHEREGEYEEAVTIPVQRYADSLRRKHFEDEPLTKPVQNGTEDELLPGSIAYRERKKWLNYVEMPNNPYSPEAIKKRLSAKSTSSLFDTLTSKSNTEEKFASNENVTENITVQNNKHTKENIAMSQSTECLRMNGRTPSPSPRILKDVLAEEVPQYKRYGRDYYIKEAKLSSGGREKTFSDTSSISSSINKSSSLDNFDTEFASPELLIKQFNTIAANQEYTKFGGKEQMPKSITTGPVDNENDILIDYEDNDEQAIYVAKPALVEDTDRKFEEILAITNKSDQQLGVEDIHELEKSPSNHSIENSIGSSSIEDSIKIYNVQTGEIVKCKPEDKVSRYEQTADDDKINSADKEIPGEIIDRLSQNVHLDDETLTRIDLKENKLQNISEIDEILPVLPKVKELAKKFVSMDNLSEPSKPPHELWRKRSRENLLDSKNGNKQMYMHSLTARSISKEFREELKLSMPTSIKVPGGTKEIPEGTEEVVKESSRPGSPVPEPGTIKTKLAFFESLKSRFNGK
ncbi:uncharacterized protein LOC123696652 isoform X2 [Colias croceus]|uniref:uncharacterized protein LOC123696652 isoform X2 n=1 Tax=Colias crocea TaxID=72248 RepID=UPI001E27DB78|nr:uncharacterized protein LOC123696652 isoform X2 [Colias croceus]